jgi:hypothetical protein
MSFSSLPAIGFTLTLPDATTVVSVDDNLNGANAVEVPDNCRTIVIFNMNATNRVFVKFARTDEIGGLGVNINNSTVLPASSSMTFGVGYVGDRPPLAQAGVTNLYLLAETGTAVLVNVTYLQGRGSDLF